MKSISSERKDARLLRLAHFFAAAVIGGLLTAATFMIGQPAPFFEPVQVGTNFGGAERSVFHIATDKPIYRTGEKLYVRAVALRSNSHSPVTTPGTASFEIKSPRGETVASGVSEIIDSVMGFSWDIPATQAGGEYTVRVIQPWGSPAERKFDIRTYRAPRLKSQIVFVRDGYGPGDQVAANLHVERAEGGFPTGAKVSVTARVDGRDVWSGGTSVDAFGDAGTSFKLPASIARGEGVLSMVIQDGGTVETATKTIPILLQTLDLAIYPEGGDLVAGLPNRVYVEGRTPAQKPADMAGIIVNGAGRQVATFRTEHEGRGRFTFTPIKGEKYSLQISEPAGIKMVFPLPAVKESGVVISSTADVSRRQEDVVVHVGASTGGIYGIALTQRGTEIAFKRISLRSNQFADVAFTVPTSLDGVIVATVYDDNKIPMAERLLFREPEKKLKVKVVPDRTDYVPGDRVTLRVTTTDENGKPLGAVVGLTVTDSSVLEMIEKREQAPRLPVMVLLENEVHNLADAHVYLDENNPKAPLATDLLLGTQGWRRFLNAGTGAISGAITDATGAVIPGVTIRATNMDTGDALDVATNDRGAYAFPSIRSGTYQLTASLPGFQTETLTGVQVAFNKNVKRDVALKVGMVNQMAEVAVAFDKLAFAGANAVRVMPMAAPVAKFEPLANAGPKDEDILPERQQGQIKPQALANQAAFALRDRADFARKELVGNTSVVREYAHVLRPNWTAGERSDFVETVYWNAGVKTNAATGTATISFNLSDSVTAFRVLADGFTQNGTIGSGVSEIESVQPFSIEPKIPLQVTSGDVIQLPIGMINGTSKELRGVTVSLNNIAGLKFTSLGDNLSTLRSKERARNIFQIDTGEFAGFANLTLDARAGMFHDSVIRKLDVRSAGFPHESAMGGVLESNGSKSFEFNLPREIVAGSVSSTVSVYPTPLASMTDALQSLLREPYGCFEQTSSTSYPLVMAQQYFRTHAGVDPAIVEKAKGLLEISYKRLTGFESRSKGYEWFGADPGHEALTAYGLMQFTDMSQVRTVDKDMLDRTRAWLLSRRDGKGGFNRNAKALDSFGGAPTDTTNAYIVWALVEAGEKNLEKEIAGVKAVAASTQDSYVLALAANVLHATGDHAGARQLLDKLVTHQDAAGKVNGAVTSITRSGGDSLAIEATALSVLAWMREPAYASQVEKGIRWIVESNKSGRFGSTQSTVLALRSIVAYDAARAKPKAPGRITLSVDGKAIGEPLSFNASTQGALVLPEFASKLGPGKHIVVLKMDSGSNMPFAMSVKYHSTLPESSEQARIGIQVALKDGQVQEGAVTEAVVSIANKTADVIPTPVAIVGIPGGLEVRHDQLKELVKSGKIDAYEVIGREVVLYWRYLKAKDNLDLPLSLVAAVPGSYTGPASRAYLYYTDEYKTWAPGVKVSITPRQSR